MARAVGDKIKQLRLSLGLNQAQFAKRMEVTQATVSRWERGAMPEPQKLSHLAELTGETIQAFIGGSVQKPATSGSLNRFWVRGTVQAGVWALAYEWPQDDWIPYAGGSHIEAPEGTRFGLRAEGASMNLVYPPGTILDCVNLEAWNKELENGRRVIVERHKADGTVEATVKEYYRDDTGREWLIPRSTDPAFQAPISASDPGDGIEEIRIVAIVVGSYQAEE
jgi:transcriptional regulator with XRE-family HTH domain